MFNRNEHAHYFNEDALKVDSNDSNSNIDHYHKILRVYYTPYTVSDVLHTPH